MTRSRAKDIVPEAPRTLVFVCHGPSCGERGGAELCRQLREQLADSPARRSVRVCEAGCMDNCATGPNVLIASESQLRTGQVPTAIPALVAELVGMRDTAATVMVVAQVIAPVVAQVIAPLAAQVIAPAIVPASAQPGAAPGGSPQSDARSGPSLAGPAGPR
jgi:(2Fe-2S) ferredoxin